MLFIWILQIWILNQIVLAQPPACYRSSKYLVPKTSGDNGFRITVEGSYKTYVPGRTYKGKILVDYKMCSMKGFFSSSS